jgi:hypothetical protein
MCTMAWPWWLQAYGRWPTLYRVALGLFSTASLAALTVFIVAVIYYLVRWLWLSAFAFLSDQQEENANRVIELMDAPIVNQLAYNPPRDGRMAQAPQPADVNTLRGSYWRGLVRDMRAKHVCVDTDAQRLVIRRDVYATARADGVWPCHIGDHIDLVVELVLVPSAAVLAAAQLRASTAARLRRREARRWYLPSFSSAAAWADALFPASDYGFA